MKEGMFTQFEDGELDWLRKEVERHGEAKVAKEIGLNQLTIVRMLAGLRVQRGTAALYRQHLSTVPVQL